MNGVKLKLHCMELAMVKKLLCECDNENCKKEFLIKYEGYIPLDVTYCKKCINEEYVVK